MTTEAPRPPAQLPADPAQYDSVRAQHARARGLSAPYIAGGRDPDPETGRREERRYVRILVFMVVAITIGGFLLDTLIGYILGTR